MGFEHRPACLQSLGASGYTVPHSEPAGSFETRAYINSKFNNKYIDEHSIHVLEVVNDKAADAEEHTELNTKRLHLEKATFVLKFFGNGFTLSMQVKHV